MVAGLAEVEMILYRIVRGTVPEHSFWVKTIVLIVEAGSYEGKHFGTYIICRGYIYSDVY